jgi:TPR repeat protein
LEVPNNFHLELKNFIGKVQENNLRASSKITAEILHLDEFRSFAKRSKDFLKAPKDQALVAFKSFYEGLNLETRKTQEKSLGQSLWWVDRTASLGDPQYLLLLGLFYLAEGLTKGENEKIKAYGCLKRAAHFGSGRAGYYLGRLCLSGTLEKIAEKNAQEWFLEAQALGDRPSALELAKIYRKGAPADLEKAENLLLEMAATGYLPAIAELSFLLQEKGGETNLKNAFLLLKKAVENGFLEGAMELSRMYQSGIGTIIKPKLAKKWALLAESQKRGPHD